MLVEEIRRLLKIEDIQEVAQVRVIRLWHLQPHCLCRMLNIFIDNSWIEDIILLGELQEKEPEMNSIATIRDFKVFMVIFHNWVMVSGRYLLFFLLNFFNKTFLLDSMDSGSPGQASSSSRPASFPGEVSASEHSSGTMERNASGNVSVEASTSGQQIAPPTTPQPQPAQPQQAQAAVAAAAAAAAAAPKPNQHVLQFPAYKFLMRTDFFNLLHLNDEALSQYNGSTTLKHMVTKIRRDGNDQATSSFERYQHNRDLVALLNRFAETSKSFPEGLFSFGLSSFFVEW